MSWRRRRYTAVAVCGQQGRPGCINMSPSPRPGSTTGARFGLTSEVQQLTCVLFVLVCAVSRPVGASAPLIATPSPYLPPLLTFENGTDVSDEAGWRQRRLEVSRLAQEAFLGTYPADVPPLISHTVLNVTEAGEGVSCTFVELTFDTSRGGGSVPTVTLPLEIIAPTDAISRPVFLTQWNHRQWALEGVARGYIGVVYPGSDAKDVAPLFQRAYPNSTFALITARAFVGSRCLDFVLAHWPNVNSDQVALTGHSRNVKPTAILLRPSSSRPACLQPAASLHVKDRCGIARKLSLGIRRDGCAGKAVACVRSAGRARDSYRRILPRRSNRLAVPLQLGELLRGISTHRYSCTPVTC